MVAPLIATPADFVIQRKTSDVVIRSSDGCEFPCRKLFLSAASPVFEDMFEGDKLLSTGLKSHDGLPTVTMAETAYQLEMFLRFTHRELSRPRDMSFDSVTTLLQMGDKFQSQAITSTATLYLFTHIHSHPLLVFSIAVAYRNLELARLAVAKLPSGGRSLVKVPLAYLRRFSAEAIQSFSEMKDREPSLRHAYSSDQWEDMAKSFKI